MCIVALACTRRGHVLHTREGFRRMARGLSLVRRCYDNLWEDERIEELVRRDSPGFASYLQAAKKSASRARPARPALENWDSLPDLDKVNAPLFAFIRLPHLVDDRIKSWSVINGECVFDTLRQVFPAGPDDETDVERFAIECEHLWERLSALYPNLLDRSDWERAGALLGVDVQCPTVIARVEAQLAPMPRTGRPIRRFTQRVAPPST